MKMTLNQLSRRVREEAGKVGWALLWLLGVPLPILLIMYACSGPH